ncbi:LutC/YkgG family protein [Helicobacter bizzozeronii]|uniref:LUD domain-containing protein n=1 Tax=Helicobacter bizzozeronii (strain CIII-1) TaxID=1002804 RepID=F8KTS4_HELBC|nr:lactate utilization protein C [Helicobacter bizzozeronii]CCB80244.1 predicted L-lactate dehydrogenase, hypothetical protein subunit YkgG [Helicobacter bizzozeronii CIII-1]
MNSRPVVLERVQNALKRHTIAHEGVHFKNMLRDEKESLLEEYIHFQTLNRAQVVQSSPENLAQDLKEVLVGFESEKILHATDLPLDLDALDSQNAWVKIPYNQSVEELKDTLFHVDTSVLKATCGIANLGMVGVVSSPASPRLSSLITLKCVFLLEKSKLVKNLYEGLEALKAQSPDRLATNMLLIGGPSRTADIELKTVFGVHGPMAVAVILY